MWPGHCSICACWRSREADPNAVWTDITSRYLHVIPHPELAWWAVRVQLVDKPGYMVNYGLGRGHHRRHPRAHRRAAGAVRGR